QAAPYAADDVLLEPLHAGERVRLLLQRLLDHVDALGEVRAEEGDRAEAERVQEHPEAERERLVDMGRRLERAEVVGRDQARVEDGGERRPRHAAAAAEGQAAVEHDQEVEGYEGAVDPVAVGHEDRGEAEVEADLRIELQPQSAAAPPQPQVKGG